MTEQPLISVIVPVYNTEKYIKDCLDSLLVQSEKNIEILVVDDGSKDNCPNILKQYAEKNPIINVFTQENAGPGAARNLALKKAKGKYVMFCDSDDMYNPQMCQEMSRVMEEQKVDFAFCDVEEYGRKIQHSHIKQHGLQEINPNIFPDIAVGVPCMIFRREILEKYNIYFLPCFYAEDFAFAVKYIFIAQRFYALNKKLYILRSRPDSLTSSVVVDEDNPRMFGNMDALEELYSFAQKYNLLPSHRNSYLKIAERLTIGSFRFMSDDNRKKAFNRMKKILLPFKGNLKDFKLLDLIAEGKEKQFLNSFKSYNMGGTRRIKMFGLTVLKIKNKVDEHIYYLLGIPLFKSIRNKENVRRYVLGVRIS